MFNVYAQRATQPDNLDPKCNAILHRENMNAFRWALSQTKSDSPSIWAAWGTLIEKRTYEHYRDNCVKHIIPAIGEIQLGNLTPRVLQRFFNEQARTGNLRTGGPLSTKSLRNMRAVLDVALKLATAEELMPSNPVPLTAIKSVKSRRVQIMTNDSQRVLETYLFEHFGHKEAGILLALYTGMRLGEICALRWKNYQQSTGMLSVESTVRRISDIDSSPMASKTRLVFGSVKTTSSERELYMPDVVNKGLQVIHIVHMQNLVSCF